MKAVHNKSKQTDLEEMVKEIENQDNQEDVITQKENFDHNQGLCIKLAVEIESNFKLYSYRILSPENYVENIKYLVNEFNTQLKD